MTEKVIVTAIRVEMTREDWELNDDDPSPQLRNPRRDSILEARFAWEPGMRSEQFRYYRGYGTNPREAIAELFNVRERDHEYT